MTALTHEMHLVLLLNTSAFAILKKDSINTVRDAIKFLKLTFSSTFICNMVQMKLLCAISPPYQLLYETLKHLNRIITREAWVMCSRQLNWRNSLQ